MSISVTSNLTVFWRFLTHRDVILFQLLLLHKYQNNIPVINGYPKGKQQDRFRGGSRISIQGAHLKKLRRAEGGANFLGVFRIKNHDFTPKNHIFSNSRGGVRPPGSAPAFTLFSLQCLFYFSFSVNICTVFIELSHISHFFIYNRHNQTSLTHPKHLVAPVCCWGSCCSYLF